MALTIRDSIVGLNTYEKKDVQYHVTTRIVAQILDKRGNVIIESTNEWEVRELYRLIKGRPL